MSNVQIVVPEATTNYIQNPSAEEDVTTGVVAFGGAGIAHAGDRQKFDAWAFKVTPVVPIASGIILNIAHTLGPTETWTASCWFYGDTGTVYDISLTNVAGAVMGGHTAAFTATGIWQRVTLTAAPVGAALPGYVMLSRAAQADTNPFWVDGVQMEEKAYATTFCDGDRDGCWWGGTWALSESYRTEQSRAGGREIDLATHGITTDVLSGAGYPPITHQAQPYALMPGGYLQSIKTNPRLITLACHTSTTTEATKFDALHNILDDLKHERVATLQPLILRCDVTGTVVETMCYYDAGLEGSLVQLCYDVFVLRLISYDPYWYEIGNSADPLDTQDTAAMRYIIQRLDRIGETLDGQWDVMGPPAAAAVNGDVYAVLIGSNGNIYIGGNFTGWDGSGAGQQDYVSYWDGSAWALWGGAGVVNGLVKAIIEAPDGTIYVGGDFGNLGGPTGDCVAKWTPAGAWAPVSGGGTLGVQALAIDQAGLLYIGGDFTTWAGLPANTGDHIVSWNGVAYAGLGNGLNSDVRALAVAPDNKLWLGGAFTTEAGGGVTMNCIGTWDGTIYAAVGGGTNEGLNNPVEGLAIAEDGTVYVTGLFTQTAGGGTTGLTYIAKWDGSAWSALGSGLDSTGYVIRIAPDGVLYVGGAFDSAGGIGTAQGIARWNGYTWAHLDVDLPATPANDVHTIAIGDADPVVTQNYRVILGCAQTVVGTAGYAGRVTVTAASLGSGVQYPWFRIIRSGGTAARIISIRNETTGKELLLNLQLLDGEIVTIDTRPGQKSIISDWQGNRLGDLLPPSDLAEFNLLPGENKVTCLVTRTGAPTIRGHVLWRVTHLGVEGSE